MKTEKRKPRNERKKKKQNIEEADVKQWNTVKTKKPNETRERKKN